MPKILDFVYFVLILWQSDTKQEILNQSCKELFILAELTIVSVGSDNIFNIEVNGGFAINMIVHNSLTQNKNRLTIWIYASFMNSLMSKKKMMLESGKCPLNALAC